MRRPAARDTLRGSGPRGLRGGLCACAPAWHLPVCCSSWPGTRPSKGIWPHKRRSVQPGMCNQIHFETPGVKWLAVGSRRGARSDQDDLNNKLEDAMPDKIMPVRTPKGRRAVPQAQNRAVPSGWSPRTRRGTQPPPTSSRILYLRVSQGMGHRPPVSDGPNATVSHSSHSSEKQRAEAFKREFKSDHGRQVKRNQVRI